MFKFQPKISVLVLKCRVFNDKACEISVEINFQYYVNSVNINGS